MSSRLNLANKFFKNFLTCTLCLNILCQAICLVIIIPTFFFIYTTFTGQKYFHTKIFPYIFHIKPLIFKTFSWSHSLSDFLEIFTFKSRIDWSLFSCNFFELFFTSIYDLNINIYSWRHNFLWSNSKIWWKKSNFVFKSCHKEKYK